jgi:gas vesicle protein
MSRSSDIALAFLAGAVAGGVIGLLLAPDKGEVTRGRIKKGATDAYGRSREFVSGSRRELQEKAGELSEKARGKFESVTDAARSQIDAVKGAVAEGKEAYRREMEKTS